MTPTIKHLTPAVVAVVGLPEQYRSYQYAIILTHVDHSLQTLDVQNVDTGEYEWAAKLPQGNYTIIGWSDELDEATCAGLVEKDPLDGSMYVDYTKTFEWLDGATESFASLLRSHGIEGRALILRKID